MKWVIAGFIIAKIENYFKNKNNKVESCEELDKALDFK